MTCESLISHSKLKVTIGPNKSLAELDWPICALCGQSILPSYKYQELHYSCREFLDLLPKGARVIVILPMKKEKK